MNEYRSDRITPLILNMLELEDGRPSA